MYRIRTKFLFGADVGRSQIAMSTNATMLEEPPKGPKGVACATLIKADLHDWMEEKHARLHTIVNLAANPRFGIGSIVRMVRPLRKGMIIAHTPGAAVDPFQERSPR